MVLSHFYQVLPLQVIIIVYSINKVSTSFIKQTLLEFWNYYTLLKLLYTIHLASFVSHYCESKVTSGGVMVSKVD